MKQIFHLCPKTDSGKPLFCNMFLAFCICSAKTGSSEFTSTYERLKGVLTASVQFLKGNFTEAIFPLFLLQGLNTKMYGMICGSTFTPIRKPIH